MIIVKYKKVLGCHKGSSITLMDDNLNKCVYEVIDIE